MSTYAGRREIWKQTHGEGLVVEQPWPTVDEDALLAAVKEIAVQVNGKFVLTVEVGQGPEKGGR